jgi:putative phosphoesterase
MRVAAIYDIHGNLPALESVLHDIQDAGVGQIVVGGDVLPGPMPRETLACLLDLDIPVQFICGNGDRVVLEQIRGMESLEVPEPFREAIRWNAQQLHPEYEEVLAAWPPTVRVEVDGVGRVLFCHATPRNDLEIFTRSTPEERLLPVFEGFGVPVVVCGHTHMQFDRTVGGVRVVNAGSVGMPFGDPGAYWLLLESGIQLRHTSYDLVNAAERIRATAYPQAQDFADQYVLNPPTEARMLEMFAPAELSA